MTSSHVHPVEIDGEIAGLAVRQRRGFVFYASSAGFRQLEGRTFTRRRDVERAAGQALARRIPGMVAQAMMLAALVFVGTLGSAHAAGLDAATQARIDKLEAALKAQQSQIELQSQQIRDLKTGVSNQVADVRRVAAEQPSFTLNNGRPTFSTPDGKFTMSLRGRFNFDVGTYFQQDDSGTDRRGVRDLSSGTNVRRAEIGVEGLVFKDWWYSLSYQFGGSGAEDPGKVREAYIQYRGLAPLRFSIGVYSPSLTIEDATSANDILFVERPSINNLVTDQLGGEGRTAAGIQAAGDTWFVATNVVGSPVGSTVAASFDEQVGATLRAAYSQPIFSNAGRVHVGFSGGYIFSPSQVRDPTTATTNADYAVQLRDRPELRVDGSRLIDTGALNAQNLYAIGGELAATYKNFYVQGEYYAIQVDRERTTAALSTTNRNDRNNFWGAYVQASWILTGEIRKYNTESATYQAPRPAEPFSLTEGGIGAWELAARYSFADLNDGEGQPGTALANGAVRGGEQQVIGAGINWYPNNNIRFMLDVLNVSVDRLGSTAGVNNGLQIGQTFNAVALRTQFAF